MKGRGFANRGDRSDGDRWLYGIHAVTAWLRAQPKLVRRIVCANGDGQSGRIREAVRLAQAARIPVDATSAKNLSLTTGTQRHQGLAAHCAAFPYASLADVIALQTPLVLIVDQLQDPHNLGAVLRSCDAAGVRAVVLPKDGTVGVTPVVEAAAAGAAAAVCVCRVTNLARSIDLLKQRDYWVAGLAAQATQSIFDANIPDRIALVLGGESGLRRLVLESCDLRLSIPMLGHVESLNASVAAAVALFEIRRHWASRSSTKNAAR